MENQSVVYKASDLSDHGELFRALTPPARLGIFGYPIAHSASPQMQNAALSEKKHPLQYVRIEVAPEELSGALGNLASTGFLGANITIPHKQNALALVEEVSREARLMGAINTISVREEKLHGFNTDGPGFAAAIKEEFGSDLGNFRVLILGGAGGAGRAITIQCVLQACPQIILANRNREKGDLLAREIHDQFGVNVSSLSLDPEKLRKTLAAVDLIVNATPLGMKSGDPSPLPDHLIQLHHLVYDTVYSGETSALLQQAKQMGAKGANGLSMLLHQGALAYEIWFNEQAPLATMRAALSLKADL